MRRTAVCALVSWPRSMTVSTLSVRNHLGIVAKSSAITPKSTTDRTAMPKDLVVSSSEMASTGPNSPMAPAPMK